MIGSPLTASSAKQTLARLLRAKPDVAHFELLDGLKVTERSWVFSAQVNDEKVVVKRILGKDAPHTVQRLKDELDYLETVFPAGKLQANRCRHAWPDEGLVILSFAPGRRLGDAIAMASGQARHDLLKQSGEWLKQYCAARSLNRTFWPGSSIRKLAAKPLEPIALDDDKRVLQRLFADLRRQAKDVKGVPFVQAATHGDFVGINAHYHEGTIYGVDIQGQCWLAVARDIARFLVWQQIHDSSRPLVRQYGICADDLQSFLSSNILGLEEQQTTLPFFIGTQLYSRFVHEYDRDDMRDNTRSAIVSYLGER